MAEWGEVGLRVEAGRGMIGGRRKRAEGNGLGEVVRAREWGEGVGPRDTDRVRRGGGIGSDDAIRSRNGDVIIALYERNEAIASMGLCFKYLRSRIATFTWWSLIPDRDPRNEACRHRCGASRKSVGYTQHARDSVVGLDQNRAWVNARRSLSSRPA